MQMLLLSLWSLPLAKVLQQRHAPLTCTKVLSPARLGIITLLMLFRRMLCCDLVRDSYYLCLLSSVHFLICCTDILYLTFAMLLFSSLSNRFLFFPQIYNDFPSFTVMSKESSGCFIFLSLSEGVVMLFQSPCQPVKTFETVTVMEMHLTI